MRHSPGILAAALSLLAWASPAQAVVVLDFEGIGDNVAIGDFYNGGAGTDYGVGFSSNALGLVDADSGGSGNFGGEPSPVTIAYFSPDSPMTMNVFGGFDTGLAFYYTSLLPSTGGSLGLVSIWSEINGGGTLLASLTLPLTPLGGAPDPTGQFSPLVPIGIAFDGTAQSVTFAGTPIYLGFDDVTLGSSAPVPEPSTLLLVGSALLAVALHRRRRSS